ASGANMADFGGYHMPLWYETGVKQEHLTILKSAGIFDTSHMACLTCRGKDAFSLLQFCFTRDIESVKTGRCIYGAFLDNNGYSIDDAIVYKFSDELFMICVNSGMGAKISSHLINNKKKRSVEINDLTGRIAKMDIQGRNSARILSKVLKSPDQIFKKMPYFSFKNVELLDGTNVLLSRSGYTGEFGFEIFVTPFTIVSLWDDILKAGKKYNIIACGLGARDSLRAGAVLPLSHQDIGNSKFINHPWDFALPFNENKTAFTKDFLGKDKLKENHTQYIYPFAGDNLRKVGTSDKAFVLDKQQNKIGSILTCATDIGIGWHNNKIYSIASPDLPEHVKLKGLSCGFIMVNKKLKNGTRLELIEGKRNIKVTVMADIRPARTARIAIKNFINN
ncbi:MAG: aminomethyl transferase family protein, partial [Desulfobacteraceae bacterium]|nr:aminomethyl transferase family protein [Desulfobacteraceae bacterium]